MDKLIGLEIVAEMLGVGKKAARKILEKYDLRPIDFGRGRGCGFKWPESAIQTLIKTIYRKAQRQKETAKTPPVERLKCSMLTMSAKEIFELTQPRILQ